MCCHYENDWNIVSQSEVELPRLKLKRDALLENKEIVKKLDSDILEATPNEELQSEIERSDEVQEQVKLSIILVDETGTENGDKSSVSVGSLRGTTEPSVSVNITVPMIASPISATQPTLTTPPWIDSYTNLVRK